MKETSPIHLDLFEVIKSAIASSEGGEEISDIVAEEPDEETTTIPTDAEPAGSVKATLSHIEGTIRQFVASLVSMPQNQQLLLAFVVLYFVTKIIFGKKQYPSADAIDELSQNVEDLTNEVREMKAMLKSILELSGQKQKPPE